MAKKKENFEQRLKRLQDIVLKLEQGDLPLEKGVDLFKEGLELAKSCREQLDRARHEVEVLSRGMFKDFEAQAPGEDNNE